MDNTIEVHFDYLYYSKRRVTPVFITTEELLSFTYDGFYSRMLQEVPHIAKMVQPTESFRMILAEENRPEIDLSHKYFKSQITRLLNKGIKTIVIRLAANESPLPAVQSSKIPHLEEPKSKRCLDVSQSPNYVVGIDKQTQGQGQGNLNFNTIINNSISSEYVSNSQHVILPLERHVKRYNEIVRSIDGDLQQKKTELKELDGKLSTASIQNSGHLSACGNCHLKLGHTRKACKFSPCKSAFSCGIISKHADQKSYRANITKEVNKLESQLRKATNDLEGAKTAVERVNISSDKRIADILMNEEPGRYTTSCGRRNWLVLNKDVALLQSNLKGTLPTRTNVMNLLHTFVRKKESRPASSSTQTRRDTDHRMAPQKRVLEEEYSIKFPTKRLRGEGSDEVSVSPSCSVFLHGREKNDFHLALKLQQQEIESSNSIDFDQCKESRSEQQDEVDDSPGETINATIETDEIDELEQFEADAAAALLHLKKRKQ